jgi:disulfide oxidoreductase YuzD
MIKITLLTAPNCHLCDDAENQLKKLHTQIPFVIESIDIHTKSDYHNKYKNDIPVVLIDDEVICQHFVNLKKIRDKINSKAK